MFSKRLLLSAVAVFVFVMVYEFVFHGILLEPDYSQLPNIMRPKAEAESMMLILMAGVLLMSYMFCLIFERGYENRGLAEGARYGLLIGLLLAAPSIVFYAVMQFPGELVVKWFLGGILEMVLAGIVLAAVYGKVKG